MVKSKPNIYPKGLVYIRTHNEIFDCIGIIKDYDKGGYDKNRDKHISYYIVEVKKYMKGSYSKREQKYYLHEIKDVLSHRLNKHTIGLLYADD